MVRQRKVQSCLGFLLLLGLLLASSAPRVHAGEAPQLPAGLAIPGQSMSLPEFALPNASGDDGDIVRSEALGGKVVVIRFWASW